MTVNSAGSSADDLARPGPGKVSLAEIAARGAPLSCDEALACAHLICVAISRMASLWEIDEHLASFMPEDSTPLQPEVLPADLTGIFILDSGEISMPSFGNVTDVQSVRFVGDLLSAWLAETSLPMALRAVIGGATSTPPEYHTVAQLSQALFPHEQPDRQEIIRALYERSTGLPPALPPVQSQTPRPVPIQTQTTQPERGPDVLEQPAVHPVEALPLPVPGPSAFQQTVAFAQATSAALLDSLCEATRAAVLRASAARWPPAKTLRLAANAAVIFIAAAAGWLAATQFARPVPAPQEARSVSWPVTATATPPVTLVEATLSVVDAPSQPAPPRTASRLAPAASARATSTPATPTPARAEPANSSRQAPANYVNGELRIASDPPGAHVTVNGIGRGATPVVVRFLPPGSYTVRIIGSGYSIQERRVTITSERPRARVSVTLRAPRAVKRAP